jgi:hypothetical protein
MITKRLIAPVQNNVRYIFVREKLFNVSGVIFHFFVINVEN